MYKGIGKYSGLRVKEEDAFGVAMNICTRDQEEQIEFLKFLKDRNKPMNTPEDLEAFREDLVEWFYSGQWIWYEEGENGYDE